MPTNLQSCEPGAVSTAPSKLGVTTLARCAASAGPAREPSGSAERSEVRTTMGPLPAAFLGRTKLPVNVAPASNTT